MYGRELGFLWRDAAGLPHSLHLVSRGGNESSRGEGFLERVMLDGESLPVPGAPGESVTDEAWGFSLTFMGTSKMGPYDMDRYAAVTPWCTPWMGPLWLHCPCMTVVDAQ